MIIAFTLNRSVPTWKTGIIALKGLRHVLENICLYFVAIKYFH